MNDKKNFLVNEIIEIDDNPFDRQERIRGWDQQKLRNSRVLVFGAGAIGNETLKNLALLGVGHIYIVDFDTISTSNLSRTILFRRGDKGRYKAKIAAQRTKNLALEDSAKVSWFHGDAVWDLGTGIFRHVDLVLGCLDNVETRFAINKKCYLVKTPWIDAGIYELGGHVSVFTPPQVPCYQCGATEQQLKAARKRYSCDDFKRTVISEGKMPTVQITSSLVSAIQVQEAVKLLTKQPVKSGKKIYFQGRTNDFDIISLVENKNCTGHDSYPEIISLPLKNSVTLKTFLEVVSENHFSGCNATLDFRGDRTFIKSVSCKSCGVDIKLNKPSFRIFDTETICEVCRSNNVKFNQDLSDKPSTRSTVPTFSLAKTEKHILEMTLWDIGIPYRHILAVCDDAGNYKYYELSMDDPFSEVI
ncbi:ThiF family adenylyltransferase [Phormidium yuhuli AB48]|uniref:ThiF family adenylyltransferase n=1 Tax=Phormidium yuhuli AB48 TaxID=2940671 RepID=A0ABY5ATV2_9CYAN|nr:ThiF family adenylyltransferase [Phormidium yuhuli]USR92450.1 ThiF family adenylyltransferase [Phormidium yuhuli AB48]